MSQPTVLIADDEETICFVLAREARRRGWLPLIAANGDRAVALAAEHDLVAAILDIRLPRRDGISAARAILEARPNIALKFMTAFGDSVNPATFGAVLRVLPKPFALGAFSDWLTGLCDARHDLAASISTPVTVS